MPTITLEIFDHVVLLALVALLPWIALQRFGSLAAAVDAGDADARTGAYRMMIAQKWTLVAVIAGAWIVLGRTASSIGLAGSLTGLAVAGYALTALMIGAQLVLTRAVLRSELGRSKARRAVESASALIPHTAAENRWFTALAVTAGICEEFIYRGFLFAYIGSLIPGAPAAVAIALAGLVFGLGHLYQGAAGIVKTGVMGALFGILYWMTGSLWAPMLLHIVVDLSSGWMGRQVVREDDLEPAAA